MCCGLFYLFFFFEKWDKTVWIKTVKKPAIVKMLTSPFFVSHNDPNMTFWWSLQTLLLLLLMLDPRIGLKVDTNSVHMHFKQNVILSYNFSIFYCPPLTSRWGYQISCDQRSHTQNTKAPTQKSSIYQMHWLYWMLNTRLKQALVRWAWKHTNALICNAFYLFSAFFFIQRTKGS